jgi:hypothetical protein
MFTEGGEVHPIRDSPGYDPLEDRAYGRLREHRRHHERQQEEYERGERARDARRGYGEIKSAILKEGGIRANRDYPRDSIPRDLYNPHGKPPDEMAQVLESEGFHFGGDVEMMADVKRRRKHVEELGELRRAN